MALIDEIRRKNPSLQNRSDDEIKSLIRQSPEFQYFSDEEFDAYVGGEPQGRADAAADDPGFMAGLSAGVDQVQGMGGGLMMAAGEASGSPGMRRAGREIYQRNMEQAQVNDLGYGFTDIRSPGDAWQWAKYTAGNQLPMLAASVAGGGVGGIAAGTGARMLAGAAAKQTAARIGQAAGAAGASIGMETGAMMGETEDLDVSLAHGALAGSLDAITPVRLLRRAGAHELADKAASEISEGVLADLKLQAGRGTLRAARGGAATNLLTEASTEGLQGLINQHANYWVENNGESLLGNLSEVDVKALVDEVAAGGLMGGVVGAPAGIAERSQAKTQVARIEAAREQAAQQGGDALDQAMAGQQAEQSAQGEAKPVEDPALASEVSYRVQNAMADLDDLQNLARGASYQGQTRLRNISRMIDRAEQAVEEGNIAQAGRMVERAERIAANLRDTLRREGTAERPARREGEIVDGDEGQSPQGPAGLLQGRQGQLPPGDPSTIYADGPTADQTQYDPQARNVRRDEGLAAQRQGTERMPEDVAGRRPQIPDQDIMYGQGPVAGNANTGLDQPVSDPRFAEPAEELAQTATLRGEVIDDEWRAFAPESGTRGVPRAEMPQVKAESRGALANFLSARGIQSQEETVPANQLKPTQAEFSEVRVQAAKEREGGDRAILISSDGHVVDGHHQWLAAADQGESVRAIRLDAPIDEVLAEVRDFPSQQTDVGSPQDQAQARDDGLQRRTDGQPFASRQSALRSGYARRAQRQGRRVEAVETDGGYALQIEDDQAQTARERETILDTLRDTGRRYPGYEYSVAVQQSNAGRRISEALNLRTADNFSEVRDRAGLTTDDMRAAFEEGQQEASQAETAQQQPVEPEATDDAQPTAEQGGETPARAPERPAEESSTAGAGLNSRRRSAPSKTRRQAKPLPLRSLARKPSRQRESPRPQPSRAPAARPSVSTTSASASKVRVRIRSTR